MKLFNIPETNTCVVWEKSGNLKGYGQKRVGYKLMLVHRLVYEQEVGEIPEGMWVLHSCDNPSCYNPKHLYLGTHKDNVRDMMKKGRNTKKLTKGEVESIREDYADGGITQAKLGKIYGVTQANISLIIKRKNWR